MWNLNSFSQTDTTSTTLPNKILREVAKDLIRYDGCKEELILTNEKLERVFERELQKDIIIDLLRNKDSNSQFIITQQELQILQFEKMTDELRVELKQNKNKSRFWKVMAIISTTSLGIILVK